MGEIWTGYLFSYNTITFNIAIWNINGKYVSSEKLSLHKR